MNILFVTPYPPSRIRVRSFELLRALAKRGHTITLATLWTTPEECEDLEILRALGIHIVDFRLPTLRSLANAFFTLPTPMPLQANYCWHPQFAKQLLDLVQSTHADAVHVEHLRAARYAAYLHAALADISNAPPVMWDSVDCITHLFRQAATQSRSYKSRLITQLELGRTSRYEGWLVEQFPHTLVTSATDKRALEELAAPSHLTIHNGEARVQIVPNGVDTEYFTPSAEARQPATIVLTGKMSYHANIAAAQHLVREIMPLVWQQRTDVQVWIVGKDPTSAVLDLAKFSAPETGNVQVMGTVPDMRTYLRQATLAVAPVLYGAGVQNKVLEAMACGIPTIASPQAVSALEAEIGKAVIVGKNPQEFASAILDLLASPEKQAQLSQAGRAYVEQNHTWSSSARRLEHLYNLSN